MTFRFRVCKSALTSGAALAALTAATAAAAQDAPVSAATGANMEAPADPQEIVIAGTRVSRSGFTAPTPTAVMDEEAVQRLAPTQISEALRQLPAFRAGGTASIANVYADLRGIGSVRTLLLVDRRRHVPSTPTGQVDLNLIPTLLVKRAEVVTGGASAAWGSDAVAGVVNLMLDTDLEGVKGQFQAGISEEGDDKNYSAGLAYGTRFAGGRGHFLIGGELANSNGVRSPLSRAWGREQRGSVTNSAWATNGQPAIQYGRDIRWANQSAGGLITSGPLRGTAFGADGTPFQFDYGTVYGGVMVGGTSNGDKSTATGAQLKVPYERRNILSRLEYEVTDGVTLFGEGSYATSYAIGKGAQASFGGSAAAVNACTATTAASTSGSISVNIDNPFLPAAVRTRMINAGVNCFAMGRYSEGFGDLDMKDGSETKRGVIGINAELGNGWKLDGYFQHGESVYTSDRNGHIVLANFQRAIDAVVDPSSGKVVCRSTLTAPTNGCAPLNLFGANSPSAEARAYATGNRYNEQRLKQQVAAINISGEPFSTWAGPVSLAAGGEYRHEEAYSFSTATGTALAPGVIGGVNIKEAYVETVVPLLADAPLAQALDVNAAARHTSYSTFGGVTTWKVGLSYVVNDTLRFRTTVSRDIRAPNLNELFNPGTVSFNNLRDPLLGATNLVSVSATGSTLLSPEKATSFTGGLVYSPQWARGLRMSVDYYAIDIKDQISQIGAQNILDGCVVRKVDALCGLITRATGTNEVLALSNRFINNDSFKTSGVDVELAYSTSASAIFGNASGSFDVRLLASYLAESKTTGTAITVDRAGEYQMPNWTASGSLGYSGDRFSVNLEGRWYQGGILDAMAIPKTATGTNVASVNGSFYAFLSGSYVLTGESGRRGAEVFGLVNNLFNTAPPYPNTGLPSVSYPQNFIDVVGRAYRVGVRFRL